jgi:hypothetical protein
MENQAKTQHDVVPPHPRKGANRNGQSKHRHETLFHAKNGAPRCKLEYFQSYLPIALSTPSYTPIVVDLPATTAKQSQILNSRHSNSSTSWGSRHIYLLNIEVSP